MKQEYIKSVCELLRAGNDASEVVRGLKRTLETRGHSKLLGSVLRGVLRELRDTHTASAARVTVANKHDEKKHKDAIANALARLGTKDQYELHVDENVVGGLIVEANHHRLDMSYRRKLAELYRSITK